MFAAEIVLDAAAPQIRPGERVGDRAILGNNSNVTSAIDENFVPSEQSIDLIQLRNESIKKCFQLRNKRWRKIADLSADARVGSGESRARQQLEQVIEFLALGEGVEKY